jgi:hypothetical protein
MSGNKLPFVSSWTGATGDRLLAACDRVAHAIVVLFSQTGPTRRPRGCGVLIRIGDAYFVFTAAHVVDALRDSSLVMGRDENGTTRLGGISIGLRATMISVAGDMIAGTPPLGTSRDHDREDIGVLRITSALPAGHASYALTLADLDASLPPVDDSMFVIMGFPAKKVRVHDNGFEGKLLRYLAPEVPDELYGTVGRDRPRNLVLPWDLKRIAREDAWSDPPSLRGASGGGIWRMDSFDEHIVVGERDKLIAIFTDRLMTKPSVLVATRVRGHLEAIAKKWPEFRDRLPL